MLVQITFGKSKEGWGELAEAARYRARELAERCGLSLRQLQRRFKSEKGLTPKQWLQEQRVAAARRMISEGLRPKEIATALKFSDQSHYSKMVRAELPSAAKKRPPSRRSKRTVVRKKKR